MKKVFWLFLTFRSQLKSVWRAIGKRQSPLSADVSPEVMAQLMGPDKGPELVIDKFIPKGTSNQHLHDDLWVDVDLDGNATVYKKVNDRRRVLYRLKGDQSDQK